MFFAKKPNTKTLEKFRESYSPANGSWQALEMNQSLIEAEFESYRLEYHQKNKVSSLSWKKSEDEGKLSFNTEATIKGQQIFKGIIKSNDPCFEEYGITLEGSLHQFFKEVRDKLVSCGQNPSEGQPNMQEPQGYEWLRVSLELLKKALEQVAENRQKGESDVCQGLLFCGIHPNRNQFVFRLRLFNLDIEALEDEKGSLRVQVLDKKNQESFAGIEPTMKNVFHTQKPQVVDLFIQTLPKIALALTEPPPSK